MIELLHVNNFRCLENFTLTLADKSSALLIGGNGSGKSTVASVLELLQKIASGINNVNQLIQKSDFAHHTDRADIDFKATIEDISFSYSLGFKVDENTDQVAVTDEILEVNGKAVVARFPLDPQPLAVDPRIVLLPVKQVTSVSDPLHIFKTWLSRILILAPLPSLISGYSESETLTPNRTVTDFGAWFTGLLTHFPASYGLIEKYLRVVMPDFRDIKNPITGVESRSMTVQFQHDSESINLKFGSLSDGEKCFFICAVVLAANQSYGPLFCFWDEPDSYLSLSEVGHLIMDLRQSFQNGSQLLVTSHNPETIRRFSAENTLVLGRRNHLEPTIVRPLSEIAFTGDLINALILDDVVIGSKQV